MNAINWFFRCVIKQIWSSFLGVPISLGLHINVDVSNQLLTIHGYRAWVLLTLIMIHILAVLKHLLINKNNVFKRMWF